MKSPLHPDALLAEKEIEPGLRVFECPVSGGIWIPLQSYIDWRTRSVELTRPVSPGYVATTADDSGRRALLCPESGCLLLRYRVSPDLPFQVDRSPVTGGVWLDKGEWEALKSRGLHQQMHLIFTSHYQARIRSEEFERALEKTFQDRIGAEDFARVKEIRNWLGAHPRRRDILCYLGDTHNSASPAGAPKGAA